MAPFARHTALALALLLALPSVSARPRNIAAVPPLNGAPCFLQVNPSQVVRADAIGDILYAGHNKSYFEPLRGTLYVSSRQEVLLWRQRIMACYERAPAEPPAALPPAPAPAPAGRK
jgi:hypothetical protein